MLRINVGLYMSKKGRGRRSIASMILKDLKEESMEEDCFLVLYDFKGKISNQFYKNLEIITCPHVGTPDHDAWSG